MPNRFAQFEQEATPAQSNRFEQFAITPEPSAAPSDQPTAALPGNRFEQFTPSQDVGSPTPMPQGEVAVPEQPAGVLTRALQTAPEVTVDLAPPPGGFESLREPTPKEADPVKRGYLLPVQRNTVTGETSLAVPEIVRSAVTLPGDVYTGKTPVLEPDPITGEARPSEEVMRRSEEFAGVATTGTLAGRAVRPKPTKEAPKTAAQEVAPTPAGDDLAGNINLGRIYAPEDVKEVLRQTAKRNEDFTDARRGTISHEQTRDMASLTGMTPDKLAKRLKGQAFNAEEMFAAREMLVGQATKVRDLAKTAFGGADIDKAKFSEELTRLVAIQEQVSGATAEAGRALSQFRMMAGATKQQIAQMVEAAQGSGLDDILAKINALDDPAKVAQFASDAFKAKTSDKILEVWINALLSGPQTHAVNMLSNSLVAAWSVPETAAAAAISKFTGSGIRGREALARGFGMVEGAKEGLRAAVRGFRTEEQLFETGKIDVRRYQAIPSINVGGFEIGGKQIRLPGRLLTAEDAFFKSIGYRQEINALAMRQALNEGHKGRKLAERVAELRARPTEEMMEAARNTATKQTFTNPLGKFGRSIQQAARDVPALRVVVPFIRTPTNIVKFAAERSPLAPLFKEVRANLKGENGAIAKDQQIARIGMGSVVSATAAYMAAEGLITGGGPKDTRERSLMYSSGWQPYSVKIGDSYYSYGRLEPLGMLLGTAADFAEISGKIGKEDEKTITGLVLASVSNNLTSKTWLRGMSELIEALQDPDRYGEQYIRNLAGTLIPTGVAQIARTRDPYLREARSIIDKLKERTPGLRETLPTRKDVFGEEIKLEGGVGPDIVSPIYQSVAKDDPLIAEMLRLKVTPGRPLRAIRGVELEPEEFSALQETTGRMIRRGLETLVSNPQWAELPDEAKTDLMDEMVRKSRDYGRATVMVQFPDLVLRIAQKQQEKMQAYSPLRELQGTTPSQAQPDQQQ